MVSSKKKRGQQRKAAKSLAATNTNISNSDDSNITINNAINNEGMLLNILSSLFKGDVAHIDPEDQHKFNELLIQRGNNQITKALGWGDVIISYEQSGVLSTVLRFLQSCEHETFDDVMTSLGGDLESPSAWIRILLNAILTEPSCMLQIAKNIGPLIKCMCADTERLFFKSCQHWRDAAEPFVWLIYTMLDESNTTKDTKKEKYANILLNHDDLLRSIVQWSCGGEGNRPEIAKELDEMHVEMMIPRGEAIIRRLIATVYERKSNTGALSEEGKSLLKTIFTTSIESKGDPNGKISYVEEIIKRVKMADASGKYYLSILRAILIDINCVDKGVIAGMIDLGTNFAAVINDSESAQLVAGAAAGMISVEFALGPNDTRVAFAIRMGLIDMSLSFIERFGGQESFAEDGGDGAFSLYQMIRQAFCFVHFASLQQKTAKAVRHKKSSIEDKLVRLKENEGISKNTKCKELLEMVGSILGINGAYCCNCSKPLGRKDRKQCTGCNIMTYCSVDCQRKDWLDGGHKQVCKIQYDIEQNGQFQGRLGPLAMPEDVREAAKLKELEINTTMIQLKLFLDHSETILSQASALGIPLYDCVVDFDLRHYPVTVKVFPYTKSFKMKEEKSFEASRSKENITCIYCSRRILSWESDKNKEGPICEMQRLFPHKYLS